MVDGKMAEKAVKARRTARASACMIRKGFLFHSPPAILTSPGSGMITAPHPLSDASVTAADAFSEDLMIRLRLFSMMCRSLSPEPAADGGRFAGDVFSTIPG
ncbi:serine/threonine-protein kinase HSL1,negative regulator of Swe1 kinase [Trypanosoma cruzi]|nr:serine/threonine-protein kinase HSL1,negative regulator of Swe1 kinase [Trypanosoma cruzi]